MAFGIHMVNKSEQQPPCTQFKIQMDWESLIRPKGEPRGSFKPALIYVKDLVGQLLGYDEGIWIFLRFGRLTFMNQFSKK